MMYRLLTSRRASKGFKGIVNASSVAPSAKASDSNEKSALFHESRTHPHGFHRLSVSFIGTGTFPTVYRSSPCTVLNFDSHVWVFDVGDGSMRQLANSSLKYGQIQRIFISRLEPTHLFGLPQLLVFDTGKGCNADPLHVYGPPGLGNFVTASMEILRNQKRRQVVVHELHHPYSLHDALQDAEHLTKSTAQGHSASSPAMRNARTPSLLSTALPATSANVESLLIIKKLYPESTGFWRLVNESEVEVLANVVCQDKATFGYVVKEVNKQGSLDLDAVKTLCVPTDLIKPLKHGEEVFVAALNRMVKPSDVIKKPTAGRKVVIVNTGSDASSLLPAAQGADLIVHDSCYLSDLASTAQRLGHSTATQAAQFFLASKARFLALTRFGGINGAPRYTHSVVKQELHSILPPDAYAITRDFMELDIPRGGLSKKSGIVFSSCVTPLGLKFNREYVGDVFKGGAAGEDGREDFSVSDARESSGGSTAHAAKTMATASGSVSKTDVASARPREGRPQRAITRDAPHEVAASAATSIATTSDKEISVIAASRQHTLAQPAPARVSPIRQNTKANFTRRPLPHKTPRERPPREPRVEEDMFGPIVGKSSSL